LSNVGDEGMDAEKKCMLAALNFLVNLSEGKSGMVEHMNKWAASIVRKAPHDDDLDEWLTYVVFLEIIFIARSKTQFDYMHVSAT
jgi:hypothetical protein